MIGSGYPIKSFKLAGVIVTDRTCPLFPSGFKGLSLIFRDRPAAFPIEILRELSAVNLRVIPGSSTSPPFRDLPSDVTLIHVCAVASISNRRAWVCDAAGGGAGAGAGGGGAGCGAGSGSAA